MLRRNIYVIFILLSDPRRPHQRCAECELDEQRVPIGELILVRAHQDMGDEDDGVS